MEKDTGSNSNDDPLKSTAYFILGYIFLMAAALGWSVDTSIVYICIGIAVFFLFLGFYSHPKTKNFQEAFKSTRTQSSGTSTTFADAFAKIFQTPHGGTKHSAKPFTRPSTPEDNRRLVSFVIAGIFVMFFLFFIGSIIFSSSDDWDDDSVAYFQTAEEFYLNGNYDSAYVNYRRAWKSNDQYIEAMVGYGKVLVVRNEQDSAIILFDQALSIDPDYNDASYNKALTHYNRANYSEAIVTLAPVLKKNPDYYDAMLLIGDSYYEQKKFDDAMSWYKNAYENGGIRSRALCHLMAYIYDTQGEYAMAIDFYKEALSYDSTVVDIYTRLGELLPNEDGNYYRTQAVKLKQN